MPEAIINLAAVEPLFAPHEEPNQHRARAQGDQPAQVRKGRRPSKIAIAQSLRSHVKAWRETDYPGASDTTRELLHHWFGRDHLIEAGGQQIPFRYYFCQGEAMEAGHRIPCTSRHTHTQVWFRVIRGASPLFTGGHTPRW